MSDLFSKFSNFIESASELEIKADVTLGRRMLIDQAGELAISYAPFDFIQESARVVIVGITPGAQQASNSLLEARRGLLNGDSSHQILKAAKAFASFSGQMRSNLIGMLDRIGLHTKIGISSTASLWKEDLELVHFTSALRYPVFINGGNYSGQPRMTTSSILLKLLERYLSEEAAVLKNAVWIPLGPKVSEATDWLVANGRLQRSMVLDGLPHPSGANAERIAYFLGKKDRAALSKKTNSANLDLARERLTAQVAALA